MSNPFFALFILSNQLLVYSKDFELRVILFGWYVRLLRLIKIKTKYTMTNNRAPVSHLFKKD